MTAPTPTDPVDALIGQMYTQMVHLGLQSKDLAERMEVTPGYISHIFRGRRRNLTLTTLAKLAQALEMNVTIRLEPHFKASKALTGVIHPPEGYTYHFDTTPLDAYPPPPPPPPPPIVIEEPPAQPERPEQSPVTVTMNNPQEANPAKIVDDLLEALGNRRYGRR